MFDKTPFTTQAWQKIQPIYKDILNSKFITEMIAGSLEPEKFAFYIEQDSLYLLEFARSLAICAARNQNEQVMAQLLNFSQYALIAERELHQYYLHKYGKVKIDSKPSPACFNYTHFLKSMAQAQPYTASLAALLPCFWIYKEVGHYILNKTDDRNPYWPWIITYAGEEFSGHVNKMIAIVDNAAIEADIGAMMQAFAASSKFEYQFWEDAYDIKYFL